MKNWFLPSLIYLGFTFQVFGQIPPPEPCTDGTQESCRCESSPVLCTIDDLDGFEFSMSDFLHPEDGPEEFCGDESAAAHNPTWFSFVAWCEELELEVEIEDCSEVCLTGGPCTVLCDFLGNCTSGVQIAIFEDCSYSQEVACSVDDCGNENTKRLSMNELTVGETYHFVIDGCGGSSCDRVRVNVVGSCGSQQIEEWSNPIAGPDVSCSRDTVTYFVDSLDGAETYFWFLDGVLLDSTSTPFYNIHFPNTGSYELCVDVNNPPCVPRTDMPDELCKEIEIIETDLVGLDLSSNALCPDENLTLSTIRSGDRKEWTTTILIADRDSVVQALTMADSLTFSHSNCDSFSAYALQFLDTATLLPSIGDTLNLPDCRQSCCILFSREFVFKDDEAPQLINPPDDAVYSCVDAIPMMPDLQYNDNCSTGGIVSGEEIGLADIIDTGTFFRIWSISDRCNNLTTYQQRISIPDIEAFELTLNPPFAEVTPGEVISVEANTSLDPNEIAGLEWRPSVGLSCVDCLVTEITAQEDQTYTLRLTDTTGCSREIVFELLFREPDIEIFIPNTFSPNGDGLNDGFTLFSNGNFTNVSLVIFDRWGTLIYSSENIIPNDESSGWDGTVNGEDVVTGVYLYSFTLNYEDGHREVLTGDLTIIR